jgi:hypothetical protein
LIWEICESTQIAYPRRTADSRRKDVPLAALVLATMEEDAGAAAQPLLLTLGGQTLLERLVEQAVRIGCAHVVVCAGPLPGSLIQAVDRLRSRGHDIRLARSPREAADFLHPDETVLLLSTAFVVPDEVFTGLLSERPPAVLTLPEAWGRDRFERIDASDNWAGAAILPAYIVHETASMLGDWAFGPTLIRKAIQQGVVRRPLGVALAGTVNAVVRSAKLVPDGLLERLVFVPGLRWVAHKLALKPISPNMTASLALILALTAIGLSGLGLAVLALILMCLVHIGAILTEFLGQIGAPARPFLRQVLAARTLLLPLILLTLAGRLALTEDPMQPIVGLLIWLGLQNALLLHARWRGATLPGWRLGTAGEALLLSAFFLASWPKLGLGIALALALVAQISAQQKFERN